MKISVDMRRIRAQAKLSQLQGELLRREQSQGTYHDVRKMTRLREHIAKVKDRILRMG